MQTPKQENESFCDTTETGGDVKKLIEENNRLGWELESVNLVKNKLEMELRSTQEELSCVQEEHAKTEMFLRAHIKDLIDALGWYGGGSSIAQSMQETMNWSAVSLDGQKAKNQKGDSAPSTEEAESDELIFKEERSLKLDESFDSWPTRAEVKRTGNISHNIQ